MVKSEVITVTITLDDKQVSGTTVFWYSDDISPNALQELKEISAEKWVKSKVKYTWKDGEI